MKHKIIALKISLLAFMALVLFFATMVAVKLLTGAIFKLGINVTLFALAIVMGGVFLILIAIWLNQLLNIIQNQQVFTKTALPIVGRIKHVLFLIGLDLVATLPLVYQNAQNEDAPGLMLIGIGLVALPIAVGIFAAILEQLLIKAITMKSENDLTI